MLLRRVGIGLLAALVLLVVFGRGAARDVRQGDQCIIGANETIQGDVFVLCRTLVVNGTIGGNLFGAATKSELNGEVFGDVYLLSGQLDVNGQIGGSLHFSGGVLRLQTTAAFTGANSHLVSASLSTTLSNGVNIPDSVTAVGYQLILDGDVGREVNFWGSALLLGGDVGGDLTATVGDPQSTGISQLQTLLIPFSWDVQLIQPGLVVSENATIEGSLRYSGPVEGAINGTVEGASSFIQVNTQPDLTQIIAEEQGAQRGLSIYLSQFSREFINLAIVGVIGLLLMPRPLQQPIRNIYYRPLPSIGVGLLTFIVAFPATFIALMLILILVGILLLVQLDGLLLGLMAGGAIGLLIGLSLLFFFVAIFISRVIVCLWLGRALVRGFLGDDGSMRLTFISLLVGVVLLALLSPLPVIGWVVNALALFLGLGAIVITLQGQLRVYRDVPPLVTHHPGMPILPPRDSARNVPPPILDDRVYAPGMDNLPEGFTFWED
jgi:cytoskeletal protein CcmA (bactofilin family)